MATIVDMPPPPDRKTNSSNHGSPYGEDNSEHVQSADSSPPDDHLPRIQMPGIDVTLIANLAAKVKHEDAGLDQAHTDVAHHHSAKGKAVLHQMMNKVSGKKAAKITRKVTVEKRIADTEDSRSKVDQWKSVDVIVAIKKTNFQKAELAFAAIFLVALIVWSLTTLRVFLLTMAVVETPWLAWIVAIGPMVAAYALKQVWAVFPCERHQRIITCAFIATTIIAAVVWVATLGHQGGEAAATSVFTAAETPVNDGTRMITRVIAQVFIELAGGALLFHSFFTMLVAGQKTTEDRINERWQQETNVLHALQDELDTIKDYLAMVADWELSAEKSVEEYISKARSHLDACVTIS